MTEKIRKVLSFPSPVPAKADYQRVKSSYSVREIKQMFGLGERTVRRWTETGIIHGTPVGESGNFTYDFHALTMFRRVREMIESILRSPEGARLSTLARRLSYSDSAVLSRAFKGWKGLSPRQYKKSRSD